ncbi:MAG: low temperature requirement protein A [Saprospiraceae bacterium]
MKQNLSIKSWWGAPRKFTTEKEERKISWLELFYDLVYVIAISTVTHYVAEDFKTDTVLDYFYLFSIIFWGWLNGSLYHDLHGTEGLRTKLMTLWQMAIVAALVITLHSDEKDLLFNATIVLLIMQVYITYIWWSVGFYDKAHRRLNLPYTFLYLISFGLIFSTLFLEQPYMRIIYYISLVLNYIPPFISNVLLKNKSMELNLSSSMMERLGLFTIIIFGEVVLGLINGIIGFHHLSLEIWIEFILAICIVFMLWWLFFTMISDKECKNGFVISSLFEILFIPTLMGLGLLAASFSVLFRNFSKPEISMAWSLPCYRFSIGLFILGICAMMGFIKYSAEVNWFKNRARLSLFITGVLLMIFAFLPIEIPLLYQLLIVLLLIVTVILYLNDIWYRRLRIK